jgi:hypothetical protein
VKDVERQRQEEMDQNIVLFIYLFECRRQMRSQKELEERAHEIFELTF